MKKIANYAGWLRIAAVFIVGLAMTGCSFLKGSDPAHPKSQWVPVAWSELPELMNDDWSDGWSAWLRSCERPAPSQPHQGRVCNDVRRLAPAGVDAQRNWVIQNLQPYRVESNDGDPSGLMTSYYEPALLASRLPSAKFRTPLYGLPAGYKNRTIWYTRQEIDTLPAAQAALQGRVIAWLSDPIDAMSLQIQGSGRLLVTEPDGGQRWIRLGYAGTNEQPFRSIGRWLLDKGLTRDASWNGIKAWLAANPQRQNELLWSNPRVTFFQEGRIADDSEGPRGAQGVPLTAGRSIAVDSASIPYGTPVWLSSNSATASINKLVLAQDTGKAIQGAVRADYFAGSGAQAGAFAERIHQPLRMWVLLPR